ncbi:hypothetical protein BH11BAC2_BH11BAC2_06240 [soil metagenome]
MYLIIYNSENPYFPISPNEVFYSLDVSPIFKTEMKDDYLFKTNKEEFYLNQITHHLEGLKLNDIKAIIIDKELGGFGWKRATGLAGHIACSIFKKSDLERKPIVLTDWKDFSVEDDSLRNIQISNFFQTRGLYFRTYEKLFSSITDLVTGKPDYAIESEVNKFKSLSFQDLTIQQPNDNTHQSTNEWGAIRLAMNQGIDYQEMSFKWPEHLYFKYLIKSISTRNDSSSENNEIKGLFKKILLIDDNARMGWEEVVTKIFDCHVVSVESVNKLQEFLIPGKGDEYDLVLLDLYLENGKKDTSHSFEFLKEFKKNYPEVPIIVFTASNKAWNLRVIQDLGAEGMYIKESPVFIKDINYLNENHKNFVELIKYVYKKYTILSPYWNQIKFIQANGLFLGIENSTQRKLKDRIVERLKMFFGLLKKGFEQTNYDAETFFYSDYELAFMTLWSVLNEIQEAYFQKDQPNVIVTQGSTNLASQPSGNPITYLNTQYKKHYKWTIDSDVYCEYDYQLKAGVRQPLIGRSTNDYFLSSKSKSQIKLENGPLRRYVLHSTPQEISRDYEQLLFMQIAFILIKKFGTGTDERDPYIKSLNELNEIRNHLYLTHGDIMITNYYSKREQEKRNDGTHKITPDKDIKRLFELVGFLLTGTNIQIAF